MIRKILALTALSVVLSACESTQTESPSTQKATPAAQTSPTVASPEPSSSPVLQIKAGDKVRAVNGTFTEATVISIDEKSGKLTIKIAGQTAEKTVAVREVVKQ